MPTVPLSFGAMIPTDGNVQHIPYKALENTGSDQDFETLRMSGTADSELGFFGLVPDDYGSLPILVIWWTSETTGSNVFFDLQHRVHTPGTTLVDTITTPTELTNSVTTSSKPGSASRLEEDTIALTATDFTGEAGSPFHGAFRRRAAAEAGDTLTDEVSVIGLGFRYTVA